MADDSSAVVYQTHAEQSYAALLNRFSIPGTMQFQEYIDPRQPVKYGTYLWAYLGVVSAVCALARMPGRGQSYREELFRLLDGLEAYYDGSSDPPAYDSYLRERGGGQKYYDDNEWAGLIFVEAFHIFHREAYLQRAADLFRFALSGWTEELGGGIYWRQGDRDTKNTCSNGPAAVLALLLYRETGQQEYLDWAYRILDWLRPLKSPEGVYWDSLSQEGTIDRRTYAYNTGTPMQANALLYTITGEGRYLQEARDLAAASQRVFATERQGLSLRLYPEIPWFNTILLRGYAALSDSDPQPELTYLDGMRQNLDYAWEHARGPDGLIYPDWTGRTWGNPKGPWLLDQAAMVESYALISWYELKLS